MSLINNVKVMSKNHIIFNHKNKNEYIYDDTAFVPYNDKTDRPYQPPKRGPRKNKNPKNVIRRKNYKECMYSFCCKICGWGLKTT